MNIRSPFLKKEDEFGSLFGDEAYNIIDDKMVRESNGIWYGRRGPKSKKCFGLWFFRDLSPWRLLDPNIYSRFYPNPYIQELTQINKLFKQFSHANYGKDGVVSFVDRINLHDFFNEIVS